MIATDNLTAQRAIAVFEAAGWTASVKKAQTTESVYVTARRGAEDRWIELRISRHASPGRGGRMSRPRTTKDGVLTCVQCWEGATSRELEKKLAKYL